MVITVVVLLNFAKVYNGNITYLLPYGCYKLWW